MKLRSFNFVVLLLIISGGAFAQTLYHPGCGAGQDPKWGNDYYGNPSPYCVPRYQPPVYYQPSQYQPPTYYQPPPRYYQPPQCQMRDVCDWRANVCRRVCD